MKKMIFCTLFITAVMSIMILIIYQNDIVVHYNSLGQADGYAPAYQAIFLPLFGVLIHFLFSRINKSHVIKGESIQLFQYRLPIVVTNNNANKLQKVISDFIWSIDLVIQLIMLWVTFILLIQKNICSWMGYIFILFIVLSLILFIYRLYRYSYRFD